ncbi:MAG: bifunctional riboflavin kinase/FAD synthetase [Thermoanaerobacteraceae bacterium]|nr:bifunctional riboflavin kinase/FAD synthetase [Thermoanaerobacteraceae bacterium]
MKVYRDLSSITIPNYTACGIGNFDGIHRGHQKLVQTLLQYSQSRNLDSLIFTFDPHPSRVLSPKNSAKLIMTQNKKKQLIESYGIHHFVLAPFTQEFSKMEYKDFIYNVLIDKCRAKTVVIGFNYKFGYKGLGTAETLKQLCNKAGVDTVIIPPVTYKGNIVSSTFIRGLLEKGDVKNAAEYMGRLYTIEGYVQHGKGIGKRLGFPTANVSLEDELVLPARGVYAVLVSWDNNKYKGVANLGTKPTFDGNDLVLEIHLFDFDGILYGKKLEVSFVQNLRSEVKFDKPQDLAKQVQKDLINAKEILNAI